MRNFTVGEITRHIRRLFETDTELKDVWVQGEVSNLTKARSGHWYFTIKDAKSQLRCVMFRSQAGRVRIDVRTGDEIQVHGRVSVYDARGEYQLYADKMQAVGGIGDLYAQFEALKVKLAAEGLFDKAHKQAIPPFPQQIGVVTSPSAAAWQDIQNVLRRRFPLAPVILSPTLVQGADAPPQIMQALRRLIRYTNVDVIIIARGGGSLEDLWCFNNEMVARAVADSDIPVISGIGHDIDFTIVDFVADLRAPTPSAAAELASPNQDDLRQGLDRLQTRLISLFDSAIGEKERDLLSRQNALRYVSPRQTIEAAQDSVAAWQGRLERAAHLQILRLDERLASATKALEAANPQHILARGYALVRDDYGNIIRSALQVRKNQRLRLQLAKDEIRVRVED